MTSSSRPPSRPRLAVFVFLGVYPLVTLALYGLAPMTEGWTIWQRNLVMVPIIVVSMIWVIIPRIHRHFGRWL
ncbi:hypothetical protein M4578_08730 [Salipiger sp. P9]|uniref:hypothetical protein n=1 Tax=Salipiger pentaromativorans TaxID=2943193 RepID=UPI00215862D2|nr:hypothetical protein [Salipiger pentaromativorans]MCR8547911.1 hypothetical protein [Salipiger pentaromativorans]